MISIDFEHIKCFHNISSLDNFIYFVYNKYYIGLFPSFDSFKQSSELIELYIEFYSKKIKLYTNANVYYNVDTKKLHLYDGTITSSVVKYKYIDNYQMSLTKSGTIYITVCPTYFHNKI